MLLQPESESKRPLYSVNSQQYDTEVPIQITRPIKEIKAQNPNKVRAVTRVEKYFRLDLKS